MAKIPKNLSDKDMVGNFKDTLTFETDVSPEETPKAAVKKKPEKQSYTSEFFTPELQEKMGKALLELKLELYKTGVVDFDLKVSREGQQVILKAIPKKDKPQRK